MLDVGEDGSTFPKDPETLLFGGLAETEQEASLKGLVRFPAEPLEIEMAETPWKDISTTYVCTEQDWCVPLVYQDIMLKRVKEAGVDVRIERFNCGHGIFLTHSKEMVTVVNTAVKTISV